ncbi:MULTISPECIES: hypothetical protein [unclassified Roseitalea]|uniref:hypothetical protein n=1 Tax=unclassified Roseitalea TaxID=2639107 RepID=UPI00273F1DC9|nr:MULTISPECIES: hypothetical protein [unclassified Roseitalea]
MRAPGLGRNGALSLIDALAAMGAIFIVYALVLHWHGRAALGLWVLIIGVTGLARLADLSGAGALARLIARAHGRRDLDKARALADTVLAFLGALYAVVVLLAAIPLAWAVRAMVEPALHGQAMALFPVALTVLYLSVLATAATSALDGLQRTDLRALVTLAGRAVFVALAIALVPGQGVFGLALARAGEAATVLATGRAVLMRRLPGLRWLPTTLSRPALREALGYGGRLQLANLAAQMREPLARIVINQFGGLALLATYELANRFVDRARGLVLAAALPLVPAFARTGPGGQAAALMRRANVWIAWGTVALMAMVCLAAPLVSLVLFGAIDPIFILATAIVVPAYLANTQSVGIHHYAVGAGVLRWNIAGAFVMGAGGALAGGWAGWAIGDLAGIAGIALGQALGTLVVVFGNLRHFGLRLHEVADARPVAVSMAGLALLGAVIVAGFG